MAGGSLNLATGSSSGLDLTNIRPQVTFFKKVFKRHTNFGIESRQQSDVVGTADFGNTVTVTIDKTGSLITDMFFQFTLPPAAGQGGQTQTNRANDDEDEDDNNIEGSANGVVSKFIDYCSWVNAVGFAIIDNVELIINNSQIDKHTGLWYDIWNELTDPNRKEWNLVGKRNDTDDPSTIITSNTYYVPLKFFFNVNPGLALPIFLISEHSIKIKITFNPLVNLLTFKGNTDTRIDTTKSMSNFKFFSTYVFLEGDEETRIRNTLPAEYLIETLTLKQNITTSNAVSNILFENPTKEFLWVFRHNERISAPTIGGGGVIPNFPERNTPVTTFRNDIFNYSQSTRNNNGTFDTFTNLKIIIRNEDRIESTEASFFRLFLPYKHHSNIPGGVIDQIEKKKYIYVYSFALNPEEYQPSGSYNFTKLNDKTTFEFTGQDFTNFTLDLFAIKYEFLTITSSSVTKSNVPTQSYVDSSLEDTAKYKTKNKAIAAEIGKRYVAETPHIHVHEHAHIHKQKWSGLQGDILKKKKDLDYGK